MPREPAAGLSDIGHTVRTMDHDPLTTEQVNIIRERRSLQWQERPPQAFARVISVLTTALRAAGVKPEHVDAGDLDGEPVTLVIAGDLLFLATTHGGEPELEVLPLACIRSVNVNATAWDGFYSPPAILGLRWIINLDDGRRIPQPLDERHDGLEPEAVQSFLAALAGKTVR